LSDLHPRGADQDIIDDKARRRLLTEAGDAANLSRNARICLASSPSTNNQVELGAAWKKASTEGREYISVKLDDPTWAAPVYASLLEAEDGKGLNLLWSRRNGD